ncbi:MAG: copper resistance protein B [Paraglaciecola polaris]|uniref:copper resistance protein B n=1 Tax=Paraglaciecola polaris TaxID=222814 RepID=UPI0030029A7B
MINPLNTLSAAGILFSCSALLTSQNVEAQQYSEQSAAAQEQASGAMDHSKMAHSKMDMDATDQDTMDHSKMNHSEMDMDAMDQDAMDHSKMDHSKMNMDAMDQGTMDHSKMDHSKMDMDAMDQGTMDHSKMNHSEMDMDATDQSTMDHSNMDMDAMDQGAMDHSAMKMQPQGGEAPANARDPHAYSSGYTLTDGPYALAIPKRLTLADEHSFWSVLGDRLEYNNDENSTVYDVQGWYGTTFERAVVKAEGDVVQGQLVESQTELLWSHAFAAYWDTQLGIRYDQFDEGEDRRWLAFGFQGLAPYWFEVDVSAYLGENGRTAVSAEAEYELLLTQRWVLQSRVEMSLNGKDDEINGVGKGLSSLSAGLRLRYEFSRQFAPYVGIEWTQKYGNSADFARARDEEASNTSVVAGLRFWF